jgi:hypothetical protein
MPRTSRSTFSIPNPNSQDYIEEMKVINFSFRFAACLFLGTNITSAAAVAIDVEDRSSALQSSGEEWPGTHLTSFIPRAM